MLVIDGTEREGRHLVVLDGEPIYLTHTAFMCLLRLAVGGGWMPTNEIELNGNARRYIYYLRKESGNKIQIENRRRGYYRLKHRVKLNFLALFKLEDYEIKQLCTKKPGG